MALPTKFLPLIFLLSLCFATTIRSVDGEDCVYTLYVKTGSITDAGTDSTIGLKLNDESGRTIYIENIKSWGGLMVPGHNYFERGNLDIFSGTGYCLDGPVCAVNVTSDGSGYKPGWYLNYVDVTSTRLDGPCSQKHFTVEQWLATSEAPYQLWAEKNDCGKKLGLGLDLDLARPKAKAIDV